MREKTEPEWRPRWKATTGLDDDQLLDLVARINDVIPDYRKANGRPRAVGLYKAVVIALALLRKNLTEEVAAELFCISQPTVSRIRKMFRGVIEKILPEQPVTSDLLRAHGTVLVDGTLAPTWDYDDVDGLFSGKHHDTGLRLQVLADLTGKLLAVSEPCPGKTHDAKAFQQWNITEIVPDDVTIIGDPAYIGCGVLTGDKKPAGGELNQGQKDFNTALSSLRAAVERAIAHLKNWKVLSGRYRGRLVDFPKVIRTVVALELFRIYG